MSSGHPILELQIEDARKIIAAELHIGDKNCNHQMEQYVWRAAGTTISKESKLININKMWQKLILAARIIAAVDNPEDVCVVSTHEHGHRGIIKFSKFVGSTSTTGRFSPGTFTNHSQSGYKEPRLIIVTDPMIDHQAVREASYVNIPIIALCDLNNPIKYVDVVIPCNNKAQKAVGLTWWFLAREVLRLRGTISRSDPWSIMPDLFFFRSADDVSKQEVEDQKKIDEEKKDQNENEVFNNDDQWNNDAANQEGDDWNQNPMAEKTQATTEPADWAADETTPVAGGDWAAEKAVNDWN